MLNVITDNVSKIGMLVRKGIGVVGGVLVGFGLGADVDLNTVLTNFDVIVEGAKAIATSAQGILGAGAIIVSTILSWKAKAENAVNKDVK